MEEHCQIPNAIEKIFAASPCSVAYIGGSITVGIGASNAAETSWRALFTQYLYREFHPTYRCHISEVMGAMGALESYCAAFTLARNVLPAAPDLAFIEFCVNDNSRPDKTLVRKGMEGMVRQLLTADNPCDVMILATGNCEGSVDHAPHKEIAEYYDLPFVDLQSYLFDRLKERSQTWDDIRPAYKKDDLFHLNDYGNQLAFEAIRECFDEQVRSFAGGERATRHTPLPPPMVSDELQHARIIDPATATPGLTLEGEWEQRPPGYVPWYFDNLTAGKPGATLTLVFEGTAVAVFGLIYNNGLKLEAALDGKEIPGFYTRHVIECGKGFMLAHGLPRGRHILKLTVSQPSKRHNKLENPTARIGYLAVAGRPD
jgi:lysophospholipase L1-like esterase